LLPPEVVNGEDVRMRELRDRTRLALEAGDRRVRARAVSGKPCRGDAHLRKRLHDRGRPGLRQADIHVFRAGVVDVPDHPDLEWIAGIRGVSAEPME